MFGIDLLDDRKTIFPANNIVTKFHGSLLMIDRNNFYPLEPGFWGRVRTNSVIYGCLPFLAIAR